MVEKITEKILSTYIRSAINSCIEKTILKVAGGLSGLMGNYHEPFLGERNTATCVLLPDRGVVGKVPLIY